MNKKRSITRYCMAACLVSLFLAVLPTVPARADFVTALRQAGQLRKSSHYLAAASVYRHAIQQGIKEKGLRDLAVLGARINLAEVLYQADQRREAHRQHEVNYFDIRDALGVSHEMTGYAQALLGLSWYHMGDMARALENLRDPGGTSYIPPVKRKLPIKNIL